MHEMSLVQNLFAQLEDLAKAHGATKVHVVTMKIGPLSGVVQESFRFGFEALASETPLCKDAELIIEVPPVSFTCTECLHVTELAQARLTACPHCNNSFLIPSGGDELLLQQVQME